MGTEGGKGIESAGHANFTVKDCIGGRMSQAPSNVLGHSMSGRVGAYAGMPIHIGLGLCRIM